MSDYPSTRFMEALWRHTFGLPPRSSDAGPQPLKGQVECQSCDCYSEPHPGDSTQPNGPLCQGVDLRDGARCTIRLCPNCQGDSICYFCGRPMCLNCSRPNPNGKQRICGACEYAESF